MHTGLPKKRGGFGQVFHRFSCQGLPVSMELSVRGTSHQLHEGSRCGGASRGWCFAEFPAYLTESRTRAACSNTFESYILITNLFQNLKIKKITTNLWVIQHLLITLYKRVVGIGGGCSPSCDSWTLQKKWDAPNQATPITAVKPGAVTWRFPATGRSGRWWRYTSLWSVCLGGA